MPSGSFGLVIKSDDLPVSAIRRHAQCPELPPGDLWVFGYGSLMWNPGFRFLEATPALLRGYHRNFCIWSARYRGTPERPGLVLGLDRGGACRGIAFRIAHAEVDEVLATLWVREMSRLTYRPRVLPVAAPEHTVRALAFVADPAHPSYAGRLSEAEVAARIVHCRGARGPNIDYLANTLDHLHKLGLQDLRLRRIYARALALSGMHPPHGNAG
jgi:glutathione-specific gamma-glutamylcyclotransferase